MSTRIRDQAISADVQTTGSTQTTLLTWTPPDGCVFRISANVFALKADNSTAASWQLQTTMKRFSNVVSLLGSVGELLSGQRDAGAALWLASMDTSGATIRIRITGGLATTINWKGYINVDIFAP